MQTLPQHAQALRAFNRFYTRRIGVLSEGLLNTRLSLTESRLLWELAQQPGLTAKALVHELQLDAGYISRLLAGLRERGLVKAQRASHDGRQSLLSLTAVGKRAFASLDQRSQSQASELLGALPAAQQVELLQATSHIRRLLSPPAVRVPALRALVCGDLGWVISRHGALYAQEFGWDQRFEALVARIAADFTDRFDASRENAWIAELDGVPVGCVFLVQARHEKTQRVQAGVAQLRMLLVEPSARGHGLGQLLTNTCESFARQVGYHRMRLWTNSLLLAARHIYQHAGYVMRSSEAHHSFGHDLVGEVWEKDLQT
jgi:DNA-binding MarR family transcriptional regulator/GNAT superfamily N-acetyltransferase